MRRNVVKLMVMNAGVALAANAAIADQFQLLTGVDAGLLPGSTRVVAPSPGPGFPGSFNDGDRLAGTNLVGPAAVFAGTGTPLISPNQYGSLSFMYRRGSIPAGGSNQVPYMSVDFLGGPLIDLDGDLGNGARSLTPVSGQSAVLMPGTTSYMDLSFNSLGGTVNLNNFDVSASNAGAAQSTGTQVVSVNTLAGTSANGTLGSAINPSVDTRVGSLSSFATGVTRISDLGYEIWQDSLDEGSSSAAQLGTMQFLGGLDGWLIERDTLTGDFPTLAGLGLGSTTWPAVDASAVGQTFDTAVALAGPTATITNGNAADDFTAAGNGGLDLTDFGGDLGAYLDAVVIPNIDPLSQSFVYLESAGFGINNSFDPVFSDTVGYDVVLIAQSAPLPEPGALVLLLTGGLAAMRRRRTT